VDNEIFDGGPPSRLEIWLRLRKAGDRRMLRLVAGVAAIAWLPLLFLSSVSGDLAGVLGPGSFLQDIAVHARFLVALPLLVIAESVCVPRLGAIVRQIANSAFIGELDRPRFDSALASTRRLLESRFAEFGVIFVAYLIVAAIMNAAEAQQIPAWHRAGAGLGHQSPAGWWGLLISLPLLLVFLLGWLWRFVLWIRLLWLISRLNLHLLAAHPDRAGGLLFVSYSIRAWTLPALAPCVIAAGVIANRIIHDGASPYSYKFQVLGLVVSMIVLYTAPLAVFYRNLVSTWRLAIPTYGALAGLVGHEFERQWFKQPHALDEDPLHTPAFSATTDLYQVVENVYRMKFVPIDAHSVIFMAVVTMLPFVPLLLITEPLDALLKSIAGFLI
jgi:hypothetical protein